MRRRGFAVFLAAAAGCRRKSGQARGEIHISAAGQPSIAPLYVAYENGYFEQLGLKVKLTEIRGAGQTVPLLASGALDACFTSISPALITAVARRARLRIVAGRESLSQSCGEYGVLYGRRGAFPGGLTDLRQLRGKRISQYRPGSTSDFALDIVLESVGMSKKDVTVLHLGQPEALAAILGGRLDALDLTSRAGLAHAKGSAIGPAFRLVERAAGISVLIRSVRPAPSGRAGRSWGPRSASVSARGAGVRRRKYAEVP
jgi:NitT/TauT family transport system substrate-binding protein